VAFNNFTRFLSHTLFQEIPPAVHQAVDDFANKNPKFDIPPSFKRVTGLLARIDDHISAAASAKKGMFSPFACFIWSVADLFNSFLQLPPLLPTSVRLKTRRRAQ
jgi:hypothetical protein